MQKVIKQSYLLKGFNFVILIFALHTHPLVSQTVSPVGFRYDSSPSLSNQSGAFRNGWAGGLNAPQFNQLDLNNDGVPDLVVFDRSGNKLLTFIRSAGDGEWEHHPEYQAGFPEMHDWMLLRDYNRDGKVDLFTSAGNGISVYKNTGFSGGQLEFELISPLLFSDYGNGNLNLFVSLVDLPAINDVDGDGDLDILTFYILGTCLEYHRNFSQELYGNSDSLVFKLESDNWGHFTEDALTNQVVLNDTCNNRGKRHSGSTLLLDDIDHDGDGDLMLGDISYPELLTLINEPQGSTDIIIPTPSTYPAQFDEYAVELFPAAFKILANQDTLPDLVIAPNTEDQSANSARLCKMYSTVSENFNFTGSAQTFLSDEMVDVGRSAYPVLTDLDNDGDADLLIGNFGEFEPSVIPMADGNYRAFLTLFINSGTAQSPQFEFNSNDVGDLRSLNLKHLAPAIGDLNGDGRKDIVIGRLDGTLIFLSNSSAVIPFQYELEEGFFNQIDVGEYATPALSDMNRDGKLDLLIGNKAGYFQLYLNSGTAEQATFSSTPEALKFGAAETIDERISNNGFSAPFIWEKPDSTYLFSGSEGGTIYSWKFDPANLTAVLDKPDSTVSNLDEGSTSTGTLFDFNSDGLPELITGNRRGGLTFYQGEFPTAVSSVSQRSNLKVFPNPASTQITLSGLPVSGVVTISILDLQGRAVYSGTSSGLGVLDLAIHAFFPGIYFLTIQSEKTHSTQKIVILSHQ
jgi:hypothetical protein